MLDWIKRQIRPKRMIRCDIKPLKRVDTSGLSVERGAKALLTCYERFTDDIKRQFPKIDIISITTLGVSVDVPEDIISELANVCVLKKRS